jgi:PKD repeat protein
VTVTASDGEHTSATQTFNWTAANVAPVVGTVGVTASDACSVDLSAAFTDQGSGDTHDSSIDWGDGSATTDSHFDVIDTKIVTGSHTYSSAGTYTAAVTVTDDNAGTDTESAAAGFDTMNTPSAIMQPINAAGTRSVFKLGSTIPVKITVKDCGGNAVTSLAPTVTLYKLDGVPNPGDLETATTTVPTNGLNMRWSDTLYIYNLSTKLSQQTGAALTAGSYRVAVTDDSFFDRTTADFELKK